MAERKVLVIGATGGVGQAVARRLGAEGFEVLPTCRTAAQGRELVAAGLCRQALTMSLDQPESIEAAFATLNANGVRRLHGLVNCAAITRPRPLELEPLEEVRRTFEINVFGALRAIQLALPLLRPAQGRIVLVSSTSGSLAVPLLGAYSASKFALEAMADVLRRELAEWGVKVSLVIPGGIKTAMIERQLAEIESELKSLRTGIEARYARQYRQHRSLIRLADKSALTPERVADDVLRALRDAHPRTRYLCGLPSVTARTVRRLVPDGLIDQLFTRLPNQHE